MTARLQLPRIYPITDTWVSGLSHEEQVRQLIAGGARFVQIRDKEASARDLYASALNCVAIARENNVKIIINDRVDIALAVGADGVHLGQNDLSAAAARKILGRDAIIGASTHSLEQARAAVALPVDYIAFGPIFETNSKADPDPAVGLELIAEIKALAGDMPVVVIGGLSEHNLRAVFNAGTDSAAMISAVLSGGNTVAENYMRLSQMLNKVVNSLK